jgi:hypothetical protein
VNVLVLEALHDVVAIAPSVAVTDAVPQPSEAVAVPSAAVISEAAGLQPRVVTAPVIVITGGFLSATHVMVLAVVAVLPQASLAVNVLVCDALHEVVDIAASIAVIVVVLQPSVAVAEPSAASISEAEGLQPRVVVVPLAVMDGPLRSRIHVTVVEAVAELPQPSEAVKVLVCDALHEVVVIGPSETITAGVLQAAVAVAEPRAALISVADGLQPRVATAPVIIIVGGFGTLVHVTVVEAVAVLPQASTAVNVLVLEALHDVVAIAPSVAVTDAVPQPSEAVAVPSAAVISEAAGLQPRVVTAPVIVITGGFLSATHVMVLAVVAVLPQASLAVNVLVCDALHEVVDIAASIAVIVVVLQPSVAVAEPSAASISEAEGLQPRVVVVPLAVMDGPLRSRIHVTVVEAVAELPQPSEAVKVLVCDALHEVVVIGPSETITAGVLQAAVAVAEPRAALISVADGLQPRVATAPVIIIVGGFGTLVHVTVVEAVAVLPQASTAVNVLVLEALHDVVAIAPSVAVTDAVPQPSEAVAVPSAAVISEAAGLQPRVVTAPVIVITGGFLSATHVMVLAVVAVLPQASLAVNVLVCDALHEVVDIAASIAVIVVVLQPSVAVAEPSAASISEAEGLQPRVVVVPLAVMDGPLRSRIHVTVVEAVAELPQPSEAVKVLVCDALHEVVVIGPSETITAGVLQAAVAVAEPRAALISVADGLQPRVATAPVIIIVGGFGTLVHVTVVEAVAVLPQASTAVNVLVLEALHDVVAIAPSVAVTDAVPQPSEAVAVPSAAVISEAAGLQPRVVTAPVIVITGGFLSATHVMVLAVVAVLPQASLAVNVLVCDALHEVVDIAASIAVIVVVLQPSVAVAEPSAASISEAEGLQPRVVVVPLAVMDGPLRSRIHVTVVEAVAELPQPSEAVKVLVCDALHEVVVIGPSETITAGVLQAAVAVAEPRAALISVADGLQPRVATAPVIIIVGGFGTLVHVTVVEAVAVLPQASTAVNVLVLEALHDVVAIAPSVAVTDAVPQPSEAVAVPSAAVISEAAGLQPRVVTAPVIVITGGFLSATHVMVLAVVAVLPQASLAVNVLVCDALHEVVDIAASIAVIVVVLQPSVAVAEPSAASISEAEGLQPRVVVVPLAVMDGPLRSRIHVTVVEAVAELPQPSEAVKVLVCDALHEVVVIGPSETITAGVLQAAVAVAEPRAALISVADGLQPRVATAPVIIIVGGFGTLVHVTVVEAVAVLPQASTARECSCPGSIA